LGIVCCAGSRVGRILVVPEPALPAAAVQQPQPGRIPHLEHHQADSRANGGDQQPAFAGGGANRHGSQNGRSRRQSAHGLWMLLPEQQAGADEADSGQHAGQRCGRPVRRQHSDDACSDADEGKHPVTRASSAQVPFESDRVR
jgi:hypothetical protein